MGLDIYVHQDGVAHSIRSEEELHADADPAHLFKKNYLRSSYNGSGINSVLSDLGVPDLYAIFDHANAPTRKVTSVYISTDGGTVRFWAVTNGPRGEVIPRD